MRGDGKMGRLQCNRRETSRPAIPIGSGRTPLLAISMGSPSPWRSQPKIEQGASTRRPSMRRTGWRSFGHCLLDPYPNHHAPTWAPHRLGDHRPRSPFAIEFLGS